jgi:lysylphosphatidylglycerol synthetase-like protein (DUF2156 family)
VKSFLHTGSPAIFLQISESFAKVLSETFRLRINDMGIETEIDLTSYTRDGKAKAQLRHWINKANKEGIVVTESPIGQLNREDVHAVSDDWLRRKGREEARILTRPLVCVNEEGVRYFWAWKGGRLLGMVIFDPIYENRRLVGYYHDLVRVVHDAPNGTTDLATAHAFDVFRREGVARVSLGMSPLCHIEDRRFQHGRMLSLLVRLMYEKCNYIYPFKGNHFHKRKYAGDVKKGPVRNLVSASRDR